MRVNRGIYLAGIGITLLGACERTLPTGLQTTDLARPADAILDSGSPISDRVELIAGTPATGFADGQGAAALFNGPGGAVALPGGAALIVADTFNSVLRRIALPSAQVTTIAGRVQVQATVDGVGLAARFQSPRATEISSDGAQIYVADGPTIRRVALPGYQVTTLAGTAGMAGYMDGTGSAVRLGYLLHALALSADQNTLYIADRSNRVLRALSLASGEVRTVAGAVYAGANQSVDGASTAARFSGLGGITRTGNALYVADTFNHTIRKVSLTDFAVTTVAGAAGESGLTDGAPFTARLRTPQGLVALADALYSVSFDGVLRKIALADFAVSTILGDATDPRALDGTGAAARLGLGFAQPIALPKERAVIYLDRSANSLRRIELDAPSVRTLAGALEPQGSVDGALAQSRFVNPAALAASSDGRIFFIADAGAHTIRRVDRISGRVSTLAGKAGEQGATDGAAQDARFSEPQALSWDEHRATLYVADGGSAILRAIDVQAGRVVTLAGAAEQYGTADGAGGAARFVHPVALTLDAAQGLLYVAESAGEDRMPSGRATLRVVELATRRVTTIAGGGRAPIPQDGPLAAATFYSPSALALDPAGQRLFVAEGSRSTVRAVDLRGLTVTTLAGKNGERGPADGPVALARFDSPSGLGWDASSGALYVTDSGGHTLRRIDTREGRVSTWLGDPSRSGGFPSGPPLRFEQAPMYFPAAPVIAGGGIGYLSEAALYFAQRAEGGP